MAPYDPIRRSPVRGIVVAALSVVWMLGVLVTVALFGPGALLWLLALAVPPALLVLGHLLLDLSSDLDRARTDLATSRKAPATAPPANTLEVRLAELTATTARTEARLATFTSTRAQQAGSPVAPAETPDPRARPVGTGPVKTATPAQRAGSGPAAGPKISITSVTPVYADQSQLPFGQDDATPQDLPMTDIIRALNFPEDERDTRGFDALRRALKDPVVGRLVKASQDVLTLLSQDGIYMDDLPPDQAKPALWRRFAGGERGRAMAALGGVRDRSSLALSAGRMREDVIFRDAVHHFLRLFDRTLMGIEPRATDAELVALSDTRTARSFMLLGRVNGAFD